MSLIELRNARLFDGVSDECPEGMSVLIENGTIREVADKPIKSAEAERIDLGGRTLMPGLIDAHVHAYASDVAVQKVEARAPPIARRMRSACSGTHSTAASRPCAISAAATTACRARSRTDWSARPAFFYAGRILTMTGGHGDFRQMTERARPRRSAGAAGLQLGSVVADGVDECLKAVREELRHGAHCIKIMGSGGVASPTDPIWMNQYREDEVRAIVNETTERRTYTPAHCHPVSAIRRSVEFGVRCIEHGTLIDDDTARFVAERGAYVVPTMVIIFALVELGKKLGFPPQSQEKAEIAFRQAMTGLESMRKAGVRLGLGTDLLGETYVRQCREFSIRREVFTPVEILRQATSVNAEILLQQDRLGCVKPGAHADLLVVDGDPLADIELLAANGRNLRLIMRAGELVKNELH